MDTSIVEVKKYFQINDMQQFREEWNNLSSEDKNELKRLVGIEKEEGRFKP